MKFIITPLSILKKLLILIGILLLGNIISLIIKFNTDSRYITKFFDFNREGNLPAVYSSMTIFFCAFLLYYISRSLTNNSKTKKTSWFILALIFLFLGFDELLSFHEVLISIVKKYVNVGGYLYFAWVIPYGIAIIFLGIIYIRFLLNLPKKIRLIFILSAILFVGGAMGIELIEGNHAEIHGYHTLQFAIMYTMEELLEMLGIALFIYGLLTYISNFTNSKTLKVKVISDILKLKSENL